jgi:hypothetical protein
MTTQKFIILFCGVFALGFAVFHAFFWKLFNWKEDLKKINVVNRAILQIANLRLIHVFLFVAFVCFVFPEELYTTNMGKAFLVAGSLFWLGRLIEQFIFLNIKNRMVNFLSFLFAIGTILFALPLFV